jgi:hypothetical protein
MRANLPPPAFFGLNRRGGGALSAGFNPVVVNLDWHLGQVTSPPGDADSTLIRDPQLGQKTIIDRLERWAGYYPDNDET